MTRQQKRVAFGAHATPSKERGEPETNVEEVEQPEQVDDQQSSAAPDVRDPANSRYERARTALMRTTGMKADVIAKMDRDEVIRRGLKAKRILDREASKEAENQRLREELTALREGGSSIASVNGGPQSRVPPSLAEFGKPAEPLRKYIESLPEEDKVEAMAALTPFLSAHAQARADAERSHANGSEGSDAQLMAAARTKLTERIPDLADNDDFADLQAQMLLLAPSRKYLGLPRAEKFEAVMEDAARMLDFEIAGEHEQPNVPQGAARRGMLDVSHVNGDAARGQGKPMTSDQAKEALKQRFVARQRQRYG